uniref:Uncharacterized protein n=1 Tax=Cyprinodon variegatus TaxID=28743 RepID=A0A3Q2D121_CYPVA
MNCMRSFHYIEVVRINMELLRVQHTQVFVCGLDVIHVLHSLFQTSKDNLSMSGHFGVGLYSFRIVEVSKATKVPLSPGSSSITKLLMSFHLLPLSPKTNLQYICWSINH